MNTTFLTRLAAPWRRIACRIREARQLRRGLRELAQMSAHELRDLGISHASLAAAAPSSSRCA